MNEQGPRFDDFEGRDQQVIIASRIAPRLVASLKLGPLGSHLNLYHWGVFGSRQNSAPAARLMVAPIRRGTRGKQRVHFVDDRSWARRVIRDFVHNLVACEQQRTLICGSV